MEEIWKDIQGYEDLYQISNYGKVRSLPRNTTKGKILKPGKMTNGYLQVVLYKDGKRFQKKVHRLVAEAFLPNPNNLPQINHKDENKEKNVIYLNDDGSVNEEASDLEWVTAKENINYGTGIERRAKANTNGKCSKKVFQLNLDGTLLKEWSSTREIQRELGFRQNNISQCCLGKIKTSNGFIWKYKKNEEDQK